MRMKLTHLFLDLLIRCEGAAFITRVCVYDYAQWLILEEGFFLWENTVDKSEALSPNTPTG